MDKEILDIDSINPLEKVNGANNFNISLSRENLCAKKALEFLLQGTLKQKVCRFCLSIKSPLLELDQILHIGSAETLFKVSIHDMVASFHPFKIARDPNLPNKICNECVTCTINAYLFSQQCERSQRAIHNFLDDVFEKLTKLDPLEKPKRPGRQKQYPNCNKIYVEKRYVIDYAEPIIHIINRGTSNLEEEPKIGKLECLRCSQVLPNIESFINHKKIHPKSMWYNCRHCGKSFPKPNQIKRHIQYEHINKNKSKFNENSMFTCKKCLSTNNSLNKHLEHIEKHNFKTILQHLVKKDMDKLCTVCFNRDMKMVDINRRICFHGGYPDLNGETTIHKILCETLPEMCSLQNYTGTNICEKCLDQAITSYIFVHRSCYIRHRLENCITLILKKLYPECESENNLMIEISQNIILSIKDENSVYDLLLLNEDIEFGDSTLKADVLEDEFRIDSENESENVDINNGTLQTLRLTEAENVINSAYKEEFGNNVQKCNVVRTCEENYTSNINKIFTNGLFLTTESIKKKNKVRNGKRTNFVDGLNNETYYNLARCATKTYMKRKLVNEYESSDKIQKNNTCIEFLILKKRKKGVKKFLKLTCPHCCKFFISGYYLRIHILKHLNKTVECNKCGLTFKSKFLLQEHIKMMHLLRQNNFSSCKICRRNFANENNMKLHLKSHDTKRCQLCEKVFVSQYHFDIHIQRHILKYNMVRLKNVHNCSFCEKEFADKNKLLLHVNKVHLQMKPFSCVMCEKQFYTHTNLKEHIKIHSLPSKEICQLCSKIFKFRKYLVIHIRKHLKMKPYHCEICRLSFYSKYDLKKHFCKTLKL